MNDVHGREMECWIAWVRLAAVPFAVLQVAISPNYPPGYEARAWLITAVLGAGAVAIFWLARREFGARAQAVLGASALAFDTVVVSAYVLVFYFQSGSPIRQLLYLVMVEGAVRYGIRGGLRFTSTPNRRFNFATVTSMCDCPWPVSSSSFVCWSRV